jgi:hypothetical protein
MVLVSANNGRSSQRLIKKRGRGCQGYLAEFQQWIRLLQQSYQPIIQRYLGLVPASGQSTKSGTCNIFAAALQLMAISASRLCGANLACLTRVRRLTS